MDMVTVGFEPTRILHPTDLKSVALDHSAMIPFQYIIVVIFLNTLII